MHRVVIVGGGFGGLYAIRALRRAPVDVTLVDRRNFHLFQPLLYQVATGSLTPGEIAAPLRAILRDQKNVRVLLGDAVDLDAENHRLILADGEVPYDTLIVATGAQNYFFGHDEWQKLAPGLKSIEDATTIRHNLLYAFEAAEREPDPALRRAWLTFVIVGAGPTGVELSGALAEIAHDTLRHDFRSINPEESRILLLDTAAHVLPSFARSLSEDAERSLIKLGVRPRTGVVVTAIDDRGVTLDTPSGRERIEARTVIWAAGVAPSAFGKVLAKRAGAALDNQGHVVVDAQLNIANHPEIFVIGDLALYEQNGKPLPGVAPVAMQQGKYAARAVADRLSGRPVKPFRYFNKGSLAVIGRRAGVAEFGRLRFHGVIAWMLWLFVHLMYLVQFRSRVIVFIRWGFEYLTFDRGSRLITQTEQPGPRTK
ncbi:MAG: NAD(P)/FAD-dependent oxidoreductase [Bryobacteraceae bacterium]